MFHLKYKVINNKLLQNMKTKTIWYYVSIKSSVLKKKQSSVLLIQSSFRNKSKEKNDRSEMVCQFLKDKKKMTLFRSENFGHVKV